MQNAKYKIFKNKKGFNDIVIVSIITFIFFGVGLIIPFVNTEFGTTSGTFDTDNVANELVQEQGLKDQEIDVSIGAVFKSIGKMFFWTFGDLPFWLDGIFLVLRIILVVVLARNFIPFIAGGG